MPDDDAELFWGLRGGGGNFGVVTSMEMALHPVGPTVLGGVVFYAGDDAAEVVAGWRDYVDDAPDELSSLVNLTTAPPAPFLPEEWHFKKVAAIAVCWAGDPAAGMDVVQPLRTLGTVVADLIGPIPYVELQQLLDGLWTAGSANYFTSAFIDRLPDDAVATFADFHRRSADLPVQAELHIHHLGGAMARVPPTPPRSPIAPRRTSSTASPGLPTSTTSRRTASGPRRHAKRWPATAPGAPT